MNYKVSIIIAAYNVEKYIGRCLESVLNQTYHNIEIVIVNDGSTDDTMHIISEYHDSRLRVLDQKNQGLSASRNNGIRASSGDYIMFIDGDDYISYNCVGQLIAGCQEDDETDVVLFPYYRLYGARRLFVALCDKNKKLTPQTVLQRLVGPTDDEVSNPNRISVLNTAWGKLYRKKIIQNIWFEDLKKIGGEDGWFNIQVFREVNKVTYIDTCFYYYERTNAVSITHKYDKNFYDRRKYGYALIRNFTQENDLQCWNRNLDNRIVIEIIGYIEKIICSGCSYREQKAELDKALKDQLYIDAIREFPINRMPLVWKLFFFFCRQQNSGILIVFSRLFYGIKRYVNH